MVHDAEEKMTAVGCERVTSRIPCVLLAPSFLPTHGGVETLLYSVFSRLADSTTVITFNCPDAAVFDASSSLHTIRVPGRGTGVGYWLDSVFARIHPMLYQLYRLTMPTRRIVVRSKARLLYVGHLYGGLVALWLKRTRGLPYILFAHGNEFLPSPSPTRQMIDSLLISNILREASAIITTSTFSADLVKKWVQNRLPLTIMPLGPGLIDIEAIECKIHDNSVAPVLLSAARLVPRKGVDMVIRALPLLSNEFPDLRYVIVGNGPAKPHLETLAKTLGVHELVYFMGAVDDATLADYYHSADVFVLPVQHRPELREVEGFGIVFLEAAAFGLPVVAGRSGGVADAVLHGHTGILINPHNLKELTAALRDLLSDPDLRIRLGRAGRERVLQEMNWDRAASIVESIGRKVVFQHASE